jgi:MFS transporter, SP family, sugar:H+ symporter
MSSYMVLFFKALGIKDVYMILVLYMLTMTLGAGLGFYFPDRVGRRYILFGTSLVLCIMMYIVAGVKGFGLENSLAATRGAMALGWSST